MTTGDTRPRVVLARVIKGDVKLGPDFEYRVDRCKYAATDTVYALEEAGLVVLLPSGGVKPTPAGKAQHAEWQAERNEKSPAADVVFQPAEPDAVAA